MIEEYKNEIKNNNDKIVELKETIKKYYQKDVDINPYDLNEIDDGKLEETIEKQIKDIAKLNMIVDVEDQKVASETQQKIEKLKETETDKEFSKFYRNGVIEINGMDISVDRFYIKETEDKIGKTVFNFICTDEKIDKKLFGTIDDKENIVKNIYRLKNSMIFYQMYLDNNLFINDKIIINNQQQLNRFMQYIKAWTPDNHKMVAETMIKDVR